MKGGIRCVLGKVFLDSERLFKLQITGKLVVPMLFFFKMVLEFVE